MSIKDDVVFQITFALNRKIRESGIKEFKSKESRQALIKLAKEAVNEVDIPEEEKEQWTEFCTRFINKTG